MRGKGKERNYVMYEYITEAEVWEYRSYCAEILTDLKDNLFEKGINTQFVLVGSGGRNMVMRNGNGPFDLDYNLNIISMPVEYWNNLKKLKDTIRNELNYVVEDSWFSDGNDSTSVITANIIDKNTQVKFKVDIAILAKNEQNNYCRLIHDKRLWPERYYWNEVPNSHDVKDKVDFIKHREEWELVREEYEKLKNMYRPNHPSFICYVEAVNNVYNKLTYRR